MHGEHAQGRSKQLHTGLARLRGGLDRKHQRHEHMGRASERAAGGCGSACARVQACVHVCAHGCAHVCACVCVRARASVGMRVVLSAGARPAPYILHVQGHITLQPKACVCAPFRSGAMQCVRLTGTLQALLRATPTLRSISSRCFASCCWSRSCNRASRCAASLAASCASAACFTAASRCADSCTGTRACNIDLCVHAIHTRQATRKKPTPNHQPIHSPTYLYLRLPPTHLP